MFGKNTTHTVLLPKDIKERNNIDKFLPPKNPVIMLQKSLSVNNNIILRRH